MKKIVLFAIILVSSFTLNAQEPEKKKETKSTKTENQERKKLTSGMQGIIENAINLRYKTMMGNNTNKTNADSEDEEEWSSDEE